jgi:3-dehydroquinate synthase
VSTDRKSAQQSVRVALGARSYDILIGDSLLARASDIMTPHLASPKVVIVSDETVAGLYRDKINLGGLEAHWVVFPPGESTKSFENLQHVLDEMFTHGLERNDALIAFGGGVIGDLTGFAASVYKRGCRFVQIPTTLLSQVDSSVGGKTAINVRHGKNLVGAFYQPQLVLSDMSVLSTLPERELKAGYAEVLKYGLLGDAKFFSWLETNGTKILSGDKAATSEAVRVSCETKARIVAEDEQERGVRALLNLGHTFGHALEAEAGYDGDLLHGEAVSAGMEMAYEFSARMGLCAPEDVVRLQDHLSALDMTRTSELAHLFKSPENLLSHMDQDKKNEHGALTLILARGIGDAFVQKSADRHDVSNYLQYLSLKYSS